MTKYDIEITEPAENDLKVIGRYITKELLESAIAKKVINKIVKVIIELGEMPLRNALVADKRLALQGIRKIVIDNYIVFYIVSEKYKVVIIRILYSRRDWINLL